MNVLNEIKTLLGMEVKLAQMKLMDGVTIIEAEAFEPEMPIFIVNGEERVALPVGEYQLDNGMMLVVAIEGIISEIKEIEEEKEVEVEVEVEQPEMEQEMSTEAQPKKVVESITKEMFFSALEELKKEIDSLKSAKTELSAEPQPLTYSPEESVEKKVNLFSTKRPMTTLDSVLSKLNK
jgi:hypothetical protein